MATRSERINIHEPRYSQDTFAGRFWHYLGLCDMRNLLVSSEQLRLDLEMLRQYEAGEVNADPEAVYTAMQHRDANMHPDTGKELFWPFRVSAFVPLNVVVLVGLLNPANTTAMTIFWQWANQTYNVVMNYGNRNASSEMSTAKLLGCYGAAVGSAGGLAVGLNAFLSRAQRFPAGLRSVLTLLVPFMSVATAGVINVGLMRSPELTQGIDVYDAATDENLGKSKAAGRMAVGMTAVSRILTSGILLAVPPVIMGAIGRTGVFQGRPRVWFAAQLSSITACLWVGLPISLALFKQYPQFPVTVLEPEFSDSRSASGAPISNIYFNKGM